MNGIMRSPQSQNDGTAYRLGGGIGRFLSRDRMTPYQEKAISMKEEEIELNKALTAIAGIDQQATLIAGEGGDVDAYYAQFIDMFEKFAPYRVAGDKVLSNIDAAKVVSDNLARTVTDSVNEVTLTKSKIEKIMADKELTLTQKQEEAGTLEKRIADTIAIAEQRMASGAQQLQIIDKNLSVEQSVYTNEITKLQSLGVTTTEQKERLQLLQKQLNRVGVERGRAFEKFGSGLPTSVADDERRTALRARALKVGLPENASEVDIKLAEQALISKTEKGDRDTIPTGKPPKYETEYARKGEAFRKAIGRGLMTAISAPVEAGAYTYRSAAAAPEALVRGGAAFLGLPEPPTRPEGKPDALTQMLYNILYKQWAETPAGYEQPKPKPTAISEALFNKSGGRL